MNSRELKLREELAKWEQIIKEEKESNDKDAWIAIMSSEGICRKITQCLREAILENELLTLQQIAEALNVTEEFALFLCNREKAQQIDGTYKSKDIKQFTKYKEWQKHGALNQYMKNTLGK